MLIRPSEGVSHLRFPGSNFHLDPIAGEAITVYGDNATQVSVRDTPASDILCAQLGLPPECSDYLWLTHDLLLNALYARAIQGPCPTLWAAAHGQPPPDSAIRDEQAAACLQANIVLPGVQPLGPLETVLIQVGLDPALAIVEARGFLKGLQIIEFAVGWG